MHPKHPAALHNGHFPFAITLCLALLTKTSTKGQSWAPHIRNKGRQQVTFHNGQLQIGNTNKLTTCPFAVGTEIEIRIRKWYMENQRQIKMKYASVVPENFQRYLSLIELSVSLYWPSCFHDGLLFISCFFVWSTHFHTKTLKKGNFILFSKFTVQFYNSYSC